MTTKSLAPDASPRDLFASEARAAFNWPFTCAIAKARVIQKAEYKVGMMIENDAQPVGPPAKDYAGHEKNLPDVSPLKYTVAGVALLLALLAFIVD
ncbi:MAG: hypothetical protein WA231_21500 [Methylocella sp.]